MFLNEKGEYVKVVWSGLVFLIACVLLLHIKVLSKLLWIELQKEVQVRQSYQQQLCDALAVLRANFEVGFNH